MGTSEFYYNIEKLERPLESFALSLTKNMEDSKDLFQETVFKALKNKDKFRMGTNFKAWLMTLMRNTFINEYRRKKRIKTNSAPSDDFLFELSSSKQFNHGEINVAMEELMLVVDSVEEKLREPFWMYYIGMSYQEISDALQVPLGTIKSRIFFARKELKIKIEKLGLK